MNVARWFTIASLSGAGAGTTPTTSPDPTALTLSPDALHAVQWLISELKWVGLTFVIFLMLRGPIVAGLGRVRRVSKNSVDLAPPLPETEKFSGPVPPAESVRPPAEEPGNQTGGVEPISDGDSEDDQTPPSDPEEMRRALFLAFHFKRVDKASQLYNEWDGERHSAEDRDHVEAIYRYFAFVNAQDPAALSRLEELAERSKFQEASFFLGRAYAHARDFIRAELHFQKSLKMAPPGRRTGSIRQIVDCKLQQGDAAGALQIVGTELALVDKADARTKLYEIITTIAEHTKDLMLEAAARENVALGSPNDLTARFNAAHAQATANLAAAAILNYETLLSFDDRNPGALNNLGVEYSKCGMPIKSVQSFREASELGETLANANLANDLIQVGFADEARTLLESAAKSENPHKNVARNLASLADRIEKEDERRGSLTDIGNGEQRFLRDLVDARTVPIDATSLFSGTWLFNGESVEISTDDGMISAEFGHYPKRRLSGRISNRSASLQILQNERFLSSLPEAWVSPQDAMGVVNLTGTDLRILMPGKEQSTLFHFTRHAIPPSASSAVTSQVSEDAPRR